MSLALFSGLLLRVRSTECIDFYVFSTVHCNIIIQYIPTKCTFSKLILQFMVSSTRFEPEGSSSGRGLYIQVWYSVFFILKLQ